MTPRSKIYLAIKRSHKYQDSALTLLMPIFENYKMAMGAMVELSKPTPRYPRSSHQSGIAIFGEAPELAWQGSGKPELMELPTGTMVFPESRRVYPDPKAMTGVLGPDIVREALYDVTVKNAFTPFAHTTIKKIPE